MSSFPSGSIGNLGLEYANKDRFNAIALTIDLLRIDPVAVCHRITDPIGYWIGKESAVVSKNIETLSFEQALAGLTKLVETLESGELPLEESVAAFESGVKLSRRCEALLDQADQRLQVLDDSASDRPL